ncbi:hypothetical protein ABZ746_06085 [Streptomyces sp. NPDC020096]
MPPSQPSGFSEGQQIVRGLAVTTSTVRDLLGREPIHLSAWATAHRQELLDQLP